MRRSSMTTPHSAAFSVTTASNPRHSSTPGNGSKDVPSTRLRVRHDGRLSSNVIAAMPAGVTVTLVTPCRGGTQGPRRDWPVTRSATARQ